MTLMVSVLAFAAGIYVESRFAVYARLKTAYLTWKATR